MKRSEPVSLCVNVDFRSGEPEGNPTYPLLGRADVGFSSAERNREIPTTTGLGSEFPLTPAIGPGLAAEQVRKVGREGKHDGR
jgi:hypothetical protein